MWEPMVSLSAHSLLVVTNWTEGSLGQNYLSLITSLTVSQIFHLDIKVNIIYEIIVTKNTSHNT